MEKYNPEKIEKKWQEKWEKQGIYKAEDLPARIATQSVAGGSKKPPARNASLRSRSDAGGKKYILVEFPYPSGAGLHVGHCRSYSALDTFARKKRMEGDNVLFPMGWDAFGLPTENFAIKNKIHPQKATEQNIANFKKQIKSLGLSFDWSREINTTDPAYYKWTQWIFLKLFEKGLAYQAEMPINWCPSCKIGLANEEVVNGKCERCGATTEKQIKKQWMLKITDYADRLIEDLKKVDYPERVKTQQINWIGKSEGMEIKFIIVEKNEGDIPECRLQNKFIEVFTTRPDTLFGCTYMVVCPEHSIVASLLKSKVQIIPNCSKSNPKSKIQNRIKIENYNEVEKYLKEAKKKSDLERTDLAKEKTGVELKGIKAINPVNNKEIPIFVADYVLPHYGTGAIMAVPAHDERDFEFAKKFNLEIKQVVAPLFIGEGVNKIRKDKKNTKREVVDVIIKHWKKDEYFCLDWKKSKNDWKTFIVGGIEKGESLEEAALREAKEESGYQNMRVVKKIGNTVYSRFFAAHKDVNRHDLKRNCIYIELLDNSFIKPEQEEVKNHYGIWIKKEKVKDFINLPEMKIHWDIFQSKEKSLLENGIAINSGQFDGLTTEEFKEKIIKWLEEKGVGKKAVNYKLRDWIFSRQHYWGEPIPLVHCEKCGIVSIPKKDLPVELPFVKKYEPTKTGESPLANISKWVNVKCPKCGGDAKRETDTMPNWAGSSWYYLAYIMRGDSKFKIQNSKLFDYWMPVDFYNGGMEHTTLHLLYSRFWHKFLFDIGIVSGDEPYKKRTSHGMVLAEDGRKMSKSLGNVINPDDVVKKFGADSLRLYEMFMGPFEQAVNWSEQGVVGMQRFLEKVYKLSQNFQSISNFQFSNKSKIQNPKLDRLLHQTIKKVTEDIDNFKFNTAISQLMILANEFEKIERWLHSGDSHVEPPCEIRTSAPQPFGTMEPSVHQYLVFLKLLSPFAPHLSEEVWHNLENKNSIFKEPWPKYNSKLIKEEKINLIIQINGKFRDKIEVDADISEEKAKKNVIIREKVKKHIKNKEIKKIIFVKGKLINIVC